MTPGASTRGAGPRPPPGGPAEPGRSAGQKGNTMSRRPIPARHPDQHLVVAGWDPPLNTFFAVVQLRAHLRDPDDEEDGVILSLGDDGTTIDTPKDLAERIKAYAELDEMTLLRLAADRVINDGRTPNYIADGRAAQAFTALGFETAYEGLMSQQPAPRHQHPRIAEFVANLRASLTDP